MVLAIALGVACGPKPPPENAYQNGPALLADLRAKRARIKSFRMIGRVDHFGEKHRVQGKLYVFGELPDKLRVELVSPFGSPLNVLTVGDGEFALHDVREARFLSGPAEPCNIARLIRIELPVHDVISILIGHTPLIDGPADVRWDRDGFYRVELEEGHHRQQLEIGPSRRTLPLLRSRLGDRAGSVFDIQHARWMPVLDAGQPFRVPREIRVEMPRKKTDLLIRYDDDGVEVNVALPQDAWSQTPPPGIAVEQVTCN